MLRLVFLTSIVASCLANHNIHLHNNCGKEIWVGILGNTNPEGGGVKLYAGQSHTVNFPDHWSGRVWGRTGCGGSSCQTGDCGGGRLKCNGAGGIPPVTLAEITFDGAGNQDFYDVSLVDGYNLKMTMKPTAGTHDYANHGHYYCGNAGCNSDVNRNCPDGMKIYGTGGVVACKSACLAFGKEEYCCSGSHNTPRTCPNFYYATIFKNACPEAYSYAYDDRKSTFTCRGNGGRRSEYDVTFC
ncbi:hypothetical protein FSP39_009737 [Pinctada imbricata]|uniref:Thaumatin-like protein n=1 Tax=Pinctada imbricata TaxID=66713 RepID=A0AA88Y8F7_PINIB|nr:hypothetical protein FSP39_009737 [Pinctada imbricata]